MTKQETAVDDYGAQELAVPMVLMVLAMLPTKKVWLAEERRCYVL